MEEYCCVQSMSYSLVKDLISCVSFSAFGKQKCKNNRIYKKPMIDFIRLM
jgi:hypothetical protein